MHPQFETPPKITISVTNTCNLDCRQCYGRCTRDPSAQELGTQEWMDFIDYLHLAETAEGWKITAKAFHSEPRT